MYFPATLNEQPMISMKLKVQLCIYGLIRLLFCAFHYGRPCNSKTVNFLFLLQQQMYFPAHAQWTTNDHHEAEWSSAPVRQECSPRTGKVRYLFTVFPYFKLYFIQTIEGIYG